MSLRRFRSYPTSMSLSLLSVLWLACSTEAQAPPLKPNPAAPVLAPVVPLGAQRGKSLELTLTGSNLAQPTGLLLSFPAKVTIPAENENGRNATKLRVFLDVSADAPLGFHSLRLATERGMSNLRVVCIDDLPQLTEEDSNKRKATPQDLSMPCVVAGQVEADTSDWYRIAAKAAQRLTFEVLARRLGSDLDAQLSLYSVRTGRELARNDDAPGCQSDPRLTYLFKEDGDYLVEVKGELNRKGAETWYRLRLGDFPNATAAIPMAVQRGTKAKVNFAGPAVEGVAPLEVEAPQDLTTTTLWVAPRGANGLFGWPVALALSNHEEGHEQEPNDEPAKANRVSVPGGITGSFQRSGDVDYYGFTAKKGQKYLIEAQTLELNSPALVFLQVRNENAKTAATTSNPRASHPADQRIAFTAPDDGDYLVEVQHLLYQGGPNEVYRLTVTPEELTFELSLALDRFDVEAGSSLELPIVVNRRGYTGPIEVSVLGVPGISGNVVIPEGQPSKPNTPGATLSLKVAPDVAVGPYSLALLGKATIDGKEVVQPVSVRTAVSKSLANLQYPPGHLWGQIALAVKPGKETRDDRNSFEVDCDLCSDPSEVHRRTPARPARGCHPVVERSHESGLNRSLRPERQGGRRDAGRFAARTDRPAPKVSTDKALCW